ncbi:GDSL esterase/lipase [Dichanthelium oligosanthes]|uniref:GDSL esterase/lipase n=1 Tax=Dichanthelium oligosanthes TaxID=888268 RepID=A0A1E5VQC1_9POAL|nr:GDSL esterase/lipase [Dichanthelium oligosanthes]
MASSWLLLLLPVLCLGTLPTTSHAARAFFVFGDSLVDNGNNNYLITAARADSPPYGIDTPDHRATGRFSNGKNVPDLISEHLGAEPVLPYLSPELDGDKMLVGANFASAGVGILNDTGIQFRLYDLGARRVLVQGVGPIGCVPAELALHSLDGSCDRELQRAAEMYNPRLMSLLGELNAGYGGDVFVGVNMQRIHNDFIDDPKAYGFETATQACCGQGRFNGMGLCTMMSSLCADRDAYVFWDAFHPTERANRLIVQQFMSGSVDYIAPMNLSTVLAVDLHKEQLRT